MLLEFTKCGIKFLLNIQCYNRALISKFAPAANLNPRPKYSVFASCDERDAKTEYLGLVLSSLSEIVEVESYEWSVRAIPAGKQVRLRQARKRTCFSSVPTRSLILLEEMPLFD